MTSGVNWKPGYEKELSNIDLELSKMKPLVEEERKKNEAESQQNQDA